MNTHKKCLRREIRNISAFYKKKKNALSGAMKADFLLCVKRRHLLGKTSMT